MHRSRRSLAPLALAALAVFVAVPASSQAPVRGHGAESHDMELVGHGTRSCKVAIQTNNVEADDRGFVYLADRANTGLHIVRLTGEANRIAVGN